MKVVKIGGGCLKGIKNIQRIIALVAERCQGDCLVVSAFNGITDTLIAGMQKALTAEENIPKIINHLALVHLKIAGDLMPVGNCFERFNKDLSAGLKDLERLYYGLNFTREITPRMPTPDRPALCQEIEGRHPYAAPDRSSDRRQIRGCHR